MIESWMRRFAALASLAAIVGCGDLDNCPDARDPITIDRPEATNLATMTFESSAGWTSFDEFPAKTQLRFKHGLGVVPHGPQGYLSFTPQATNGKEGGSFTEAAGNALLWECLDSDTIVIKNDTCERKFFVKIEVFGSPNGITNNHDCGD